MTNKDKDERVRQHNHHLAINYMRKVEEDLEWCWFCKARLPKPGCRCPKCGEAQ